MLDILDGLRGDLLTLADYVADADERQFYLAAGHDSWKLERQQRFNEPAEPSWVAFSQGRWEESMWLLEDARKGIQKFFQEATKYHVNLYRVRVVAEPLSPYLQWEFRYLRIAVEYGEKIRIVDLERIKKFEENGPLPELLTAGTDTVYRILYTDEWEANAALRYVSPGANKQCVQFIRGLYAVGEELTTYFDHKVAHLAPPQMEWS